jgi:hypothetical protein
MPKRKPDKVIVHRIELNTFERDLLETALVGNVASNLVTGVTPSLVQLVGVLSDPVKLYGFLTILEMSGVLDTPIPTLGDSQNDLRSAIIAIKDYLGFELDYKQNAEANQRNAEILEQQAEMSAENAEQIARDTGQAYRDGQASYEDMMAAQREYNRQQAEAFKARKIAESWDLKFYFTMSGMQFDEDGRQIPNTGRMPTNAEIAQAKENGEYYPVKDKNRGFLGIFPRFYWGRRPDRN